MSVTSRKILHQLDRGSHATSCGLPAPIAPAPASTDKMSVVQRRALPRASPFDNGQPLRTTDILSVASLSDASPASNPSATPHPADFRLQSRQLQRRRTRCPSYKGERYHELATSIAANHFVRRTSCPSRACRMRRLRASHQPRHILRTSDCNRSRSSVDGQDVRRTKEIVTTSQPLRSRPTTSYDGHLVRRELVGCVACEQANSHATSCGLPTAIAPAPASTDKMSVVQSRASQRASHFDRGKPLRTTDILSVASLS
ncbi:MAG: hypothetical protein RLY70_3013 [Planctomycetota bacterium]